MPDWHKILENIRANRVTAQPTAATIKPVLMSEEFNKVDAQEIVLLCKAVGAALLILGLWSLVG